MMRRWGSVLLVPLAAAGAKKGRKDFSHTGTCRICLMYASHGWFQRPSNLLNLGGRRGSSPPPPSNITSSQAKYWAQAREPAAAPPSPLPLSLLVVIWLLLSKVHRTRFHLFLFLLITSHTRLLGYMCVSEHADYVHSVPIGQDCLPRQLLGSKSRHAEEGGCGGGAGRGCLGS